MLVDGRSSYTMRYRRGARWLLALPLVVLAGKIILATVVAALLLTDQSADEVAERLAGVAGDRVRVRLER